MVKYKLFLSIALFAVIFPRFFSCIANASVNFTVSSTTALSISSHSLVVDGNLNISSGTLTTTTGPIIVGGNWGNTGNFEAGSGLVTLNGTSQTITGATTFYKLSKIVSSPDTLTFSNSTTQAITNSLVLRGASGNLLSLRSSSSPTQFSITVPTGISTELAFLDVKDSNASGGKELHTTNSVDSGNNTNWSIAATPTNSSGGGGGGSKPNATPTPTIKATPTPTPTPKTTATPTPEPTPKATPTPAPKPVATATPTPTPVPIAKPVAGFTANPTNGKIPLEVKFVDNSTGEIDSRKWDFGDKKSSSEKAPLHKYSKAGKYSVSLTVTGPGGADTIEKIDFITVLKKESLLADFSASPTQGVGPLTVNFNDLSSGGDVASWQWDFGDGEGSTEQNPAHTYAKAGLFTVSLTATGPLGSNTGTKAGLIKVVAPEAPLSDFSVNSASGFSPFIVKFSDLSKGSITKWEWDFGDGAGSTEQNPSRAYTKTGNFNVSLTVSGPGGTDKKTALGLIKILENNSPLANFTASVKQGNAPLTTQFTDISTGEIKNRQWSFGDGETSVEKNPSHIYKNAGNYSVSLTITGAEDSDSKTIDAFIKVAAPEAPVAGFTSLAVKGFAPLEVQFTDKTTGKVESWLWDFGDGSTGSGQNPAHIYEKPGDYSVILTVEGESGVATREVKEKFISVLSKEAGGIKADFNVDIKEGRAPLNVQFNDLSFGDDIVSWSWNFGDGKTSNEQNPRHLYEKTGVYSISLEIANSAKDSHTTVKTGYITVLPSESPVADFNFIGSKGPAPFTTQFVDTSSGDFTEWLWDFGDGGTSSEKDPKHIYAEPGVYSVKLTIKGDSGVGFIKKDEIINVGSPSKINVDFAGIPAKGEVPLTVQFNDLSTGDIKSWLWHFGDGGAGNEQNPSHTYEIPGQYNVCLTLEDGNNESVVLVKDNFVNALKKGKLLADFSALNNKGFVPFEVQFIDNSLGAVSEWLWDFGDGGTSSAKDPKHTFLSEGKFTVSLTVTGKDGKNSKTEQDFITDLPLDDILADFSASKRTGFGKTAIEFNDMSQGSGISTWSWDFGDGQTGEGRNPKHVYGKPGNYTVKLFINNGAGKSDKSSITSKTRFITISPNDGIMAKFQADETKGKPPLKVQFTDLSEGQNIDGWLWDFGDGEAGSEQNPEHVYKTEGFFTINLIVTGDGLSANKTISNMIRVMPKDALKAEFTANPVSGAFPLQTKFEDKSEGNVDGWLWDFGDGETGSEQNPEHIYDRVGLFTVSLTVSGKGGDSDTETKQDLVRAEDLKASIRIEPETIKLGRRGKFTAFIKFESGFDVKSIDCDSIVCEGAPAQSCSITRGGRKELRVKFNIKDLTISKTGSAPFKVAGEVVAGNNRRKFEGVYYVDVIGDPDTSPLDLPEPEEEGPAKPDFAASPTDGIAPLTSQFRNMSEGAIQSQLWEFGDGGMSNVKEPVYTYASPGLYDVLLSVMAEDGETITKTKENYITVKTTGDLSPWIMFRQNKTRNGKTPYLGGLDVSLLWSFATGGIIESSPVLAPDGTIYFGSYDGNMYALNSKGQELWRFKTQGPVVSSAVTDIAGNIYFGSNDGHVYAVNSSGGLLWNFKTNGEVTASPVIDNKGNIIAGSFDNNLYSLNSGTGELVWKFRTKDSIFSSPSIDEEGSIYFGSYDGNLYALTDAGELKWKFETKNSIRSTPAITSTGVIYACSWDKNMYALDKDGKLAWKFDLTAVTDCSPAVDNNGNLCVGTDKGTLFALTSEGKLNWKMDFGQKVLLKSSPVMSPDGSIYFGASDGKVRAVDASGNLLWAFDPQGRKTFYSSPAIDRDGRIYIGGSDGILYCLGSSANPDSEDDASNRVVVENITVFEATGTSTTNLAPSESLDLELEDDNSKPEPPPPFFSR